MYVVDLAVAALDAVARARSRAAFDSPRRRPDLKAISGVTVRHREDSLAPALLFCGWLSSRLGWEPGQLSHGPRRWSGTRTRAARTSSSRLEPVEHERARAGGRDDRDCLGAAVALDRAPGGLRAMRRERDGTERAWIVMGASRGEGGILGEGCGKRCCAIPPIVPPCNRRGDGE
jgi:hypothetical protein